jgi:hypothetical protein
LIHRFANQSIAVQTDLFYKKLEEITQATPVEYRATSAKHSRRTTCRSCPPTTPFTLAPQRRMSDALHLLVLFIASRRYLDKESCSGVASLHFDQIHNLKDDLISVNCLPQDNLTDVSAAIEL